jgi:hypothetical protein
MPSKRADLCGAAVDAAAAAVQQPGIAPWAEPELVHRELTLTPALTLTLTLTTDPTALTLTLSLSFSLTLTPTLALTLALTPALTLTLTLTTDPSPDRPIGARRPIGAWIFACDA